MDLQAPELENTAANCGSHWAAGLDRAASVGGLGAGHVSREWQDSDAGR